MCRTPRTKADRLDCSVKQFEREFLIRLAPVWLACRWRIMGGRLRGRNWPKPDMANEFLGCNDYGREMKIVCNERKAA
jgi:hypothetical protein